MNLALPLGAARVEQIERLQFQGSHITMAADAAGPADGQAVLFLHGSGQSRRSWRKALTEAARLGYRALSLDLRGHGDSDWSPDGLYNTEVFVEDLAMVLERLERKPVLVGASIGGLLSMILAARTPSPVHALVVVDISPKPEAEGINEVRAFMQSAKDGFDSVDAAADAVSSFLTHRPRPKDTSGLSKSLRLRDGRFYWHWDPAFFFQMVGHQEHVRRSIGMMKEAALSLSVPTLLIRGGSSNVVSLEGARAFLELVPHAEQVDIAGAHHMVAGDANDTFNDAVFAFLRKHARADRGGTLMR